MSLIEKRKKDLKLRESLERHSKALFQLFRRVRVNSETGCWEWVGAKNGAYGVMHTKYLNSRSTCNRVMVHRYVLSLMYCRELSDRVIVRHRCDNPLCCNPDHLVLGTAKENMEDRHSRKSDPSKDRHLTCKRGHSYKVKARERNKGCPTCRYERRKEAMKIKKVLDEQAD